MSSPARTLGSWIRIPLKTWICVYYVCVRQRPCDGLIPRPRSPTDCLRLRKWSETKRFTDALRSKLEQQEEEEEEEEWRNSLYHFPWKLIGSKLNGQTDRDTHTQRAVSLLASFYDRLKTDVGNALVRKAKNVWCILSRQSLGGGGGGCVWGENIIFSNILITPHKLCKTDLLTLWIHPFHCKFWQMLWFAKGGYTLFSLLDIAAALVLK
jgi:hypothetical protein